MDFKNKESWSYYKHKGVNTMLVNPGLHGRGKGGKHKKIIYEHSKLFFNK